MSEKDALLSYPTPKNTDMFKVDSILKNIDKDTVYLHVIISQINTGCLSCFKPFTIVDYNLLEITDKAHNFQYVNSDAYIIIQIEIKDNNAILNVRELPVDYAYMYGDQSYDMTDDVPYDTFRLGQTEIVKTFDIKSQLENAKIKKNNIYITDNDIIDGYSLSFRLV